MCQGLEAILEYRNTTYKGCRSSPAQMFFGRTVRDHIPCLPYTNTASTDWCISQELIERMMAKSREVGKERETL